ncbi:putative nuclease HARBI1 [Prorops nasuta]|uniref:putative nuclease HARBI1 n=1 Tax=Prorops nasuta TaxID=863751 RepID=UPI0034CD0B37
MDNVAEEERQRQIQRNRIKWRRVNYFETLNNNEFQMKFRLSKTQFLEVLKQIEPKIQCKQRKYPIPPNIRLLTALRFYATGTFLQVVADFANISAMSAYRIVHEVSKAIADLLPNYIRLPRTDQEIMKTMKNNFSIAGMVRVIGAMDCVHVKIESYGGDDAELFRNRKGYMSINVQCMVNSDLEILDIVARWPGSTHDSTIFQNSRLKQRFDNLEFRNGAILGDRGYGNHRYLLTPLADPQTPAEFLYNESHIRTRCMVERCFGIWKRTFPVLRIGSRFQKPERTINVILATAVLHNIIRRDNRKINGSMQNYLSINAAFADPTDNDRQYLIDHYFSK